MYLEEENIESGILRQGDICSKIHLLGALNVNAFQYMYTQSDPDRITGFSIPKTPSFGDVMVLSHSCELDRSNEFKVTSIILAPLRDINTATSSDKVQELIDSNLIDPENPRNSYLKYFYLPPNPKLQHSNGAIVDFSKCFSFRNQVYDKLLSSKIAQLKENFVNSMAFKLALYFYRNNSALAA